MSNPQVHFSKDAATWTLTCEQCGGEVLVATFPVDTYLWMDAMHDHECFVASYDDDDRAWVARNLEGRVIPDE